METSDARKRHAEERQMIDATLADQAAIQICGFNIYELHWIRDNLHIAGKADLFADAVQARAEATHARAVASVYRADAERNAARAEKAEQRLAALDADLRADMLKKNSEAFERELAHPVGHCPCPQHVHEMSRQARKRWIAEATR